MLQLFKEKNYLRLCLATFLMSSCGQLVWVVMPFIVKSLGGSDTEAGLCFMGQMGVYVIFCILVSSIIDMFKPKKILLLAAAAQVLVAIAFFATVWYGSKTGIFLSPITRLILLMSLMGVVTAFFWPVMMGWISTGHEGAELTKRLGFYNTAWSSANMILPIIGGYLMEINYLWPLVLAIVCAVGSLLAASGTKCLSENPKSYENNSPDTACGQFLSEKRQFLWMARVALLATFICVGIFRSQLGILYKFELGFPESVYGWSVAIMCLFNIVVFWLMGRSHYWHYKKGLFAAAQGLLVVCMLVIILFNSLFLQLLAAGLSGICYSVAYSSHQYYGVSGGKKRSGLMAVHETILGAGIALGSLLGGIISDALGRHWPYKFGCAVIIAAGLLQVLLWKLGQSSSKPNTSVFTSPT
jgi:MFS family permease